MIRRPLSLPDMPYRGDRMAWYRRNIMAWFRSHRGWIIDGLIADELFHARCLRCLA